MPARTPGDAASPDPAELGDLGRSGPSRPSPEPTAGRGERAGNGGNGGGNGAGNGSGTIRVVAGAEALLAAAERQLAEEAERWDAGRPPVVPDHQRVVPPPAAPPLVLTELDTARLTLRERRALGKLQAKRVRRIVRGVSPWSVFKFSFVFLLCTWIVVSIAGVLLWRIAGEAGLIGNAEDFYAKAVGEETFRLDGRELFTAWAGIGAVLVIAGTLGSALLAMLFNLISDLTGGVRMTVLELEEARREIIRQRTDQIDDAVVETPSPDESAGASAFVPTASPAPLAPSNSSLDDPDLAPRAPREREPTGSHPER